MRDLQKLSMKTKTAKFKCKSIEQDEIKLKQAIHKNDIQNTLPR